VGIPLLLPRIESHLPVYLDERDGGGFAGSFLRILPGCHSHRGWGRRWISHKPPLLYVGTNEKRRAAIRMDIQSLYHRTKLEPSKKEKAWKTFRDYSNGEDFQSFFTGRAAVSLEKPWLEM
jgi:hypothetical protein